MAGKQGPRTGTQGRATKAERKEQARREREELLRRRARARRSRTIAIAGVLAVAAAVVAVLAMSSDDGGTKGGRPGQLPGLMAGPAPWPANTVDLAARLDQLQLPAVGGAIHVHSHLDVVVNGTAVSVPADIGIGADAESPLHTHDDAGVIHLESADANSKFTLGEFFDVWGVRLTPTCIGGYCDTGDAQLRVFVDGKPFDGDPRDVELRDQEQIVIAYGSKSQVPDPLPTFDWSTLNP